MVTVSSPLTSKVTGEFGYVNQHGFVADGPDTTDHAAYVGLALSL
jgi:hypothetical protein